MDCSSPGRAARLSCLGRVRAWWSCVRGVLSPRRATPAHFRHIDMSQIIQLLEGRKTYIVSALAIIYLIGSDLGWWPRNNEVLAILGFGGLAALRAGVQKSGSDSTRP